MDGANLTSKQEEELMEMEHIRWCRYHFVNHWSYDKIRDNRKRNHPMLVSYKELSREEQLKDLEVVKQMLKK